jgi:hypothetical protein
MCTFRSILEIVYQLLAALTIVFTFMYSLLGERVFFWRYPKISILDRYGYLTKQQSEKGILDARYYHLNISINNRYSLTTRDVEVRLKKIRVDDPTGDKTLYKGDIRLLWRYHRERSNTGEHPKLPYDCDLFLIVKPDNGNPYLLFLAELYPPDLDKAIHDINTEKPKRIIVSIQLVHENHISRPKEFCITWNGKWSADSTIMGEYLKFFAL